MPKSDMLVLVRWEGRKLALPVAQFTAIDPDESTAEAVGDWHYWVAQGYLSTPSATRMCLKPPTTPAFGTCRANADIVDFESDTTLDSASAIGTKRAYR